MAPAQNTSASVLMKMYFEQDAQFIGGCDGNTKGVCALIQGMKAKEVIARLKGITCGNKPTSCPDQLATALQEMGY